MTVPAASANTASTAALNFNEAGQLASITDDAASGGMNNTGLSGNGASLNLSGFTGSDIAGSSLQIGDIAIDIPEDSSGTETEIAYNQEVTTTVDPETGKEKTITAITTNANLQADDSSPYVFTRGDGVSETVQPTYLKDDSGIYGINLPTNTSITGPFDNITELNGNAFDIDPATEGTVYTFGDAAGTQTFAVLRDGDAVNTAGITKFITAEDGTFTIFDQSVAIAGNSSVAFTVDDETLSATVNKGALTILETTASLLGNDAITFTFNDKTF